MVLLHHILPSRAAGPGAGLDRERHLVGAGWNWGRVSHFRRGVNAGFLLPWSPRLRGWGKSFCLLLLTEDMKIQRDMQHLS